VGWAFPSSMLQAARWSWPTAGSTPAIASEQKGLPVHDVERVVSVPPTPVSRSPKAKKKERQATGLYMNLRRTRIGSGSEGEDSPWNADASPRNEPMRIEWEDKARAVPVRDLRRRARIKWGSPVERVLLVKKWKNHRATGMSRKMIEFLTGRGIKVFVEGSQLVDYAGLSVETMDDKDPMGDIDLAVTVGGDGTLLHLGRLFDQSADTDDYGPLPPCLVFSMGSLGFLANWSAAGDKWREALEKAMRGHKESLHATMRVRLRCCANLGPGLGTQTHLALNECVVLNRGDAIAKIEVYVDGDFLTRLEGDGLVVSTATGSTGYNMSCGGSIVAPSVPCMLLTPIAAASLSFRPLMINEMSVLRLVLPPNARTKSLDVIYDGRKGAPLSPGGFVEIAVSNWPLPVINVNHFDSDFMEGLSSKLKWNARGAEQEDDPISPQLTPQ